MEDAKINWNTQKTLPDNSSDLVLRRADWRFLLCDPNPKKSIVFGNGIHAEAVYMISGTTVESGESRYKADCDLAVVVKPDDKTLEEAWSYLEPGGAIFSEWVLNPLSGTGPIQDKLEAIGFRDVKFYLPKPSPFKSPPTTWFPLGKEEIARFVIQSGYPDKTESPVKRIIKEMRRLLWSLNPNLFTAYPWLMSSDLTKFVVCSVAYKPITPGVIENSIADLQKTYAENGGSVVNMQELIGICLTRLNSQTQESDTSILIQSREERIEKAILFIFAKLASEPYFVVKMARTKEPDFSLTNGAFMLKGINEKFDDVRGIPKVLFSGYVSELFTVAETFLGGTQSSKIVDRSNYEELAHKATSWLIAFGLKTKVVAPKNAIYNHIIKPELQKIEIITNLALSPEQARLTRNLIAKLDLSFLVCEHGDFAPQNVHINSKKELEVLDWENARFHGIPAFDLIFFLTYLNFHFQRAWNSGKFLDCYRETMDRSSYSGEIFHSCLDQYGDSLGISAQAMDLLRVLTWVSRTLRYLNIGKVDLQVIEDIRISFPLSLWKEEMRRLSSFYTTDID